MIALQQAPAAALDLKMPFPLRGVLADPAQHDSYDLPIAPWTEAGMVVERVEGVKDRRAYRLDAAGASLLEVSGPLRDQLLAQGYQLRLDCKAQDCGGFDFRFATEVMPEPEMHVDLADYRFVAATRGEEAVSVMVSRTAQSAFVQVITVGKDAQPAPPVATPAPGAAPVAAPAAPVTPTAAPAPVTPVAPVSPSSEPVDVVARLDTGLPAALDDLVFASGASALAEGDYASLATLADWLAADPARRIILVGHTDISGGLPQNVALSKKRAESVRQVLIGRYGIAAARLLAEGVGPLSPRAENASEEGRTRNRRVEAVPGQM